MEDDVSIFREIMQEKYNNGFIDDFTTMRIYLPLNEAVEQLLEILNNKRKKYGKVRKSITVQDFKTVPVFSSVISNHIELKNSKLQTFALAAENYRVFSISEEEGNEMIDGIQIVDRTEDFLILGGLLMTDTQYKNLTYWAKHNISNEKEMELITEEEFENMIDAEIRNIGTHIKVIRDLVKNFPQKRWKNFAEIEFQFYEDLRAYLRVFEKGVKRKNISNWKVPNEFNIRNNIEEIINMVMLESYKLLTNLERYKICYNEKEWIDGEDIADIPFEEYIRLSNGACWAVENLITHFENVKGFNRAPNVRGYPTRTLFNRWEPELDREHFFNHPLAKERRVREWYENRKTELGDYANIISESTMQTMKELLEILASKGPAFVRALRNELPPQALEALRRAKGVISETREYKETISGIVNELLKSQASYKLIEYVNRLPREEYNALNEFEPDLIPILTSCSMGKACVWYTADVVRNAYNDIAEVKGIEKIFTGKSKFDHVARIKIEFE